MYNFAVEPTHCHLCHLPVVIWDGITADASPDPSAAFEDLIEHECTESEDIEDYEN